MKQLKLLFFVCLLAVTFSAGAKTYPYTTVTGDPTGTRIYTLDNGLTVYLSVNKEKPRIQTYIAVRTGSRNDPAETTGLAHYLEHLMFKGTNQFGTIDAEREAPLLDSIEARYEHYRTLTDPEQRRVCYHEIDSISQLAAQYNIPNEYDKLMAAIGSEGSNAYTSTDVTCYIEDIPSNEIDNWARIQADRFQNMVIRGFHTELEAVYEEKNISLAKDTWKMFDAMAAMLYPTHPYGTQTTIGTQEHLKNPSIVNIKNYFHNYYCPNNVAICMSGDLDPALTIAIIDKYFGSWQRNARLARPEFAPLQPITAVRDTVVNGQEAEMLMLAWRLDAARSIQNDTAQVVAEMLHNGNAGLFDLNLNQKMRLLDASVMMDLMTDYSAIYLVGVPKEGQSLEEVRDLLLGEVNRLRNGDFSDELLPSVVNNIKRQFNEQLEDNRSRASIMVNSFIYGESWQQAMTVNERISHLTKQQVMDWARENLRDDNYVVAYKRQAEDNTVKKIEKPAITPIPTNRDLQSPFVAEIVASEVEPIEPTFVDYNHDIEHLSLKGKRNVPVLYKKNTENDLFTLQYVYKIGMTADNRLDAATDYIQYLGTKRLDNEQFAQAMYALACDYSVSTSGDATYVTIHGLGENMDRAVELVEDLLNNARPDAAAYEDLVDLTLKDREDAKTNQQSCFAHLRNYGIFGAYNPSTNIMSEAQLRSTNPEDLVKLIKSLGAYEHTVLYYGPQTENELLATLNKRHKIAKKQLPTPAAKDYEEQITSENEILIAPYEAKNIYMLQYHNEGRDWNPNRAATVELFNEYFGGGMNAIVFQELREARGLAYSAGALYVTPSKKGHPEYAYTLIITQNDKMMDAVNQFNELLNDMPRSEAAFQLAKDATLKRLASARTTKFSVLSSYMAAQKLGIDYDINAKVYNTLSPLELSDIVRFERETMRQKPYRYIILGDENDLDMEAIGKIGTIRRVTLEDIFGY